MKLVWIPGLLAACSGVTTPQVTAWQADFSAGRTPDALGGSVAVLSQPDRLDASIQINNAPAGANLTWLLRNGSCQQPGDVVGGRAVYPALTPDSAGSASAEAIANATLDPGGHYQASVLAADTVALACADLQRE